MKTAKPDADPSALWSLAAVAPFEQAVDHDDGGAGELVAAGDPAAHVLAVVDEELQVQLWRTLTGVAVAGRRLGDAPQTPPKGDIGGLDGVEE